MHWEEVSCSSNSTPQNFWGITLVPRYPDDNQFLAYYPNSRTHWMLTVQGLHARWDVYNFKGISKNCTYHQVEPQFPYTVINNNTKPQMISRGNLRGRVYNRSQIQQSYRPTSRILSTNTRGENVFSHGGAYFYLDNDIADPILRKLQITQSNSPNSPNTKNTESVSIYRRKWGTCICFGQILMCYGGSLVDISQKYHILEPQDKINFANPLLLYNFSEFFNKFT